MYEENMKNQKATGNDAQLGQAGKPVRYLYRHWTDDLSVAVSIKEKSEEMGRIARIRPKMKKGKRDGWYVYEFEGEVE